MERRKLKWLTWGVVIFMVVVVGWMLSGTLRRTSYITLPQPGQVPEQSDSAYVGNALTVVEVTPETVQATIQTLSRPESYRRSVTVEQFWDGGSGSYEVAVAVMGAWTRADRTMPDGRVRHALIGPETAYIWYNSERQVYVGSAGVGSADAEQYLPTYEDVLALPVEQITAADYRLLSDLPCIYVETAEDAYVSRYWVSVDSGLLAAAERLERGTVVYRMAALSVDLTAPAEAFTLPDGTSVLP